MAKRPTFPQQRQRGLSWLLYTIEGAQANIAHARELAAQELSSQEWNSIESLLSRLEIEGHRVRAAFGVQFPREIK